MNNKIYKVYLEKGYIITTYYNQYGFDYDILVDVEDIHKYLLNNYSRNIANNLYKRCLKDIHFLWNVVLILDENDREDWRNTKRDIFNERGGLFVD